MQTIILSRNAACLLLCPFAPKHACGHTCIYYIWYIHTYNINGIKCMPQ